MSLSLSIDGQPVTVAPGTSAAAAIAQHAGIGAATRRSVVEDQPRAPLCGMGVCHECRVHVDGNVRLACQTPCREGMIIRTGAPAASMPVRSGIAPVPLAVVETAPICDLLVIGAGPAGLAAAAGAAPSGARVVLVDDNPAPGGQVWRQGVRAPASEALKRALDQVTRHDNVALLTGTRVCAIGAHAPSPALLVEDEQRARLVPYRKLVLCTGARELLLPFPGWTLPGVTGVGGLQALVKAGLPVREQRIVLAGSGPLLLSTAATLRAAGARVLRVAEQAPWSAVAAFAAALPRWPGKLWQAMALADPSWRAASWVVAAEGDTQVRAVRLQRHGGRTSEWLECDRVACGFGLVPNVELGRALGCAVGSGDAKGATRSHHGFVVDELQRTSVAACFAAGECTGIGGHERARVQGRIAGLAAIGDIAGARLLAAQRTRWQGFGDRVSTAFALRPELRQLPRHDTLVCRCEDVPHAQLQRVGGWIEAKLHTRCGMGPCQGRVCGAAAQWLYGWSPPPPPRHVVSPVRIGSLV